jgi:hypothetical protein
MEKRVGRAGGFNRRQMLEDSLQSMLEQGDHADSSFAAEQERCDPGKEIGTGTGRSQPPVSWVCWSYEWTRMAHL